MKKNTGWIIFFSTLIILILAEIAILLFYDFGNKSISVTDSNTSSSNDASSAKLDTSSSLYDLIDESAVIDTTDYTYIFVGDSRFVAMSDFAEDDDIFICENGETLVFLQRNMDTILEQADAETKIIIGLGVNDVNIGISNYPDVLKELAASTDAKVYYMLINPVDESLSYTSGYQISNASIDEFNADITDALQNSNIQIIDVNSYLKSVGYSSFDGLHYNPSTSEDIYKYIKNNY